MSLPTLVGCCEDSVHKSVTLIHVKKNGTGDFCSIQEAINSITGASSVKRYEILVYDHWEINRVC